MMGSVAIWLGVVLTALLGVTAGPATGVRTKEREVRRHERSEKMWHHRQELQMGVMLTEVAARLRSGATTQRAWALTLAHLHVESMIGSRAQRNRVKKYVRNFADAGRLGGLGRRRDAAALDSAGISALDPSGVPVALRQLWAMNALARRRAGLSSVAVQALPATIAVCRMGNATGAPMAEILDSCAAGVTEAGEARSARDVALAGPQASARMLAVLPVLGLALGYALGANPFAFLLGTFWGNVALVGGIACESAGVALVAHMVAQARREAEIQ